MGGFGLFVCFSKLVSWYHNLIYINQKLFAAWLSFISNCCGFQNTCTCKDTIYVINCWYPISLCVHILRAVPFGSLSNLTEVKRTYIVHLQGTHDECCFIICAVWAVSLSRDLQGFRIIGRQRETERGETQLSAFLFSVLVFLRGLKLSQWSKA